MDHQYHISARSRRRLPDFRELWQYRELIPLLAKKSFTLRYAQTLLGPLWLLLTPALSALVYALVFGRIARIGTDGVPPLLFYLCGTAVWGLFASCVSDNARTFTDNAAVFGKVYFPRLTVPIAQMLVSLGSFLLQLLPVLALLVWYFAHGSIRPDWRLWPLLPPLLLELALLGMSVGVLISSLTTKYRDLGVLVGFGVTLWMYASPVVYPLSQLERGTLRTLVLLNPVSAPLECVRHALFGAGLVSPRALFWSFLLTLFFMLLACLVFQRVERDFTDTV